MTGSELLSALDAAQTEITRLQTYRLQLLAALDTNGHAAEIGARDTIQLISVRHRLDPTEVRRDLRLATALPKYSEVQAALSTTEPSSPALHVAQAESIVTTLERIPAAAKVPVETLQVAEHELVKAAQTLAPADLRKLGKHLRDTLDTDGPEPAEARALAAETLWLRRGELGVEFGGYLAGDNAELFHTLIFAGAKPHQTPDGARDPRSRGKRQADALTAILTTAAATGTAAPAHGHIKPHITVTIALNDLTAGTGTGTLASGTTLSTSTIRRLACDAGIIPMVLGSNSEPLDVGTEHRFVTPAIRQTLNTRDKGCVICQAPTAICDAHHLTHWADGGPTTVTNLALLCKAHHIDVHQGHWTITMHQGHPQPTRPTWADKPKPP
ncbi:HNH endonuclease signature motif containing protein [Kribbella lupini]